MTRKINPRTTSLTLAAGALALAAGNANADQVILDDLIVDGSACIGQDCVNGESFGFDTIRIKENNLRIKAQDTSSTASFPTNDWQLTFNDSSNGGQNKFSVDDIDGGRTPFTLEAGAPSHSLYVDDGGRIGFGTSTPVADLHVKTGNTPTLRLEQDGTSGFSPQTWDVAGNEANYFIRDATNGSTLPFRLFPGAPSNALTIEGSTGDIGMGTTSPTASLHVQDSSAQVYVDDTGASSNARIQLKLENNGAAQIALVDGDAGSDWRIQNLTNELRFSLAGTGVAEMELDGSGNLTVTGSYKVGAQTLNVPDYVFAPDYELMPLHEVEEFIVANKHLPKIPSAAQVGEEGLDMTQMQMALLEKVEELTLYTLEQQKTIDALQERLETLAD